MTSGKPRNPYPALLRRVLRKILPPRFYRRYAGRHEDASLRLWARIAAGVPPGSAILDIGAFHGAYALAARAANPAAAVYAFEPNPQTAELLRVSCQSKGIEVRELAIAEESGTLPFLFDSARSRLADPGDPADPQETIHDVAAVTLDSWIRDNAVVPSLIKMDVEEAEAGILRRATHVLNAYQPIILCEVLTAAAGEEVMRSLPPQYHFYYIDENSGAEEHPRITRRYWRNKNWLLVPEHRRPEVSG